MNTSLEKKIREETYQLMLNNRRTKDGFQFTLPSPDLYPFQWLWDSCFHSIILSKFDVASAKEELRSAFSQPLPSGVLPHIIYWDKPKNGNWGRESRGDIINAAWGVDGTSSITQPPIMAKAVQRVYEIDNDIDFLTETYPILRKHYLCLKNERSLNENELVFIINPDESGEDNSPRFDKAQGLATHHTADENLNQRIRLIKKNATCKFDTKCISEQFSIVDIPFNVIYAESLEIMGVLARELGKLDDAELFSTIAKKLKEKILTELCSDGKCFSYDLLLKEKVDVDTWHLFMPLYGGLLSEDDAAKLVNEVLLDEKQFWTPFPVPTVSKQDESYDVSDDAFWRGHVWMAPNWFIYHGLKRYGYDDIARELKQKTLALIKQSGFREHYHPITGKGLGAPNFTWGGLVLDME